MPFVTENPPLRRGKSSPPERRKERSHASPFSGFEAKDISGDLIRSGELFFSVTNMKKHEKAVMTDLTDSLGSGKNPCSR